MTSTGWGRTMSVCGCTSGRFEVLTPTGWGRTTAICGCMLMLGRSGDVLDITPGFGGLVHALQEHCLEGVSVLDIHLPSAVDQD